MQNFKVKDCDIFYLSYDEPNAEKNYHDIYQKVTWVKRVHGVKGSDAAHKACAERSDKERFITVDGDNIINEKFIDNYLSPYIIYSRVISEKWIEEDSNEKEHAD